MTQFMTTPIESPSLAVTNEGQKKRNCVEALQPHDTSTVILDETLHDNSAKAQRARLLAYLEQHGSITTSWAREHLNIYDPRVRKHELIRQGYNIQMTWVVAITAQGYAHKVGLYTLVKEDEVQS